LELEKKYAIGVDVGSSSLRSLLINGSGDILEQKIERYHDLGKNGKFVWDKEKKMDVELLHSVILDQYEFLQKKMKSRESINALSISSIGPSTLLLNERGKPIGKAMTYAYQGAEKYVKRLDADFQIKTGGFYSSSLPFLQLMNMQDQNIREKGFTKFVTINDYLTWRMTNQTLENIFSTVPNASYTGLYSIQKKDWDETQLNTLSMNKANFPIIVPLGTCFSPSEVLIHKFPMLSDAVIVAGTIDGLDAFWAAGVSRKEKIIVGSAGTTGALRRWRKGPTSYFKSKLLLCCHIGEEDWVEIIPFNNVGTSLNWLTSLFQQKFKDDSTKNTLDLELLDIQALRNITDVQDSILKSNFSNLPIFFPYIEGEPRGPNGRGAYIRGGFIDQENTFNLKEAVDLYLALILGIVNLFRHNFEILNPSKEYTELRLTGLVAHKSQLFCKLLATGIRKIIVVPKKVRSVAWATGIRALVYTKVIPHFPKVPLAPAFSPMNGVMKKLLDESYEKYMKIYERPELYGMVK
jgi:sugar (pentulose or hexulose) kinase